MKNKSYIWISFIVLVFGIYAIPKIVTRIKNGTIVQNDRLDSSTQSENPESTLYTVGNVPAFSLTNQYNATINQNSYAGKVYVVEFFFSTCTTICPIMNRNMVELQNHFKNDPHFGIASISINPKTDTPEILKKHALDLKVTNPNWNFLTGDQDYIINLSNKGFNLFAALNPKIAQGFEHSGLFALVDKKGKIRCRRDQFGNPIAYYDGLEKAGIEMLKTDIELLLNEK